VTDHALLLDAEDIPMQATASATNAVSGCSGATAKRPLRSVR
jgi:hypothetical protein